mgnify:CR=1 FL=1
MEDFGGNTRTITQHWGPFSVSEIFDTEGDLSGFEISFGGKGFGFGGSYTEDYTKDLTNRNCSK